MNNTMETTVRRAFPRGRWRWHTDARPRRCDVCQFQIDWGSRYFADGDAQHPWCAEQTMLYLKEHS